jgi:anthranilate synthase
MIDVERRESAATAGDADAFLQALEHKPGIWMGCDVQAEGLFRKESMVCAEAALRIALIGRQLIVTPMSEAGAGLLPEVARLGTFLGEAGGLLATVSSGAWVVRFLRQFLASLRPSSREFSLFGVLAFDYYRLGHDAPLPDDGRCRLVLFLPQTVVAVDESGVRRVDFGFGKASTEVVEAAAPRAAVGEMRADEPPGRHAARVARAVELLREGGLHSLVLSQAFHRPAKVAAGRAFEALRKRNPYPAMFFCNLGGEVLFGASPDLQVRADAEWIETAPVCGTYRRGADPLDDDVQAQSLLGSGKEAAALALCADSAANELAACCQPGSVELLSHRRPYFFSTIIHTIDHLRGRRRAGVDAFDILLAHATPATVTGLPKHAAIAAIDRLEDGERGWYAGAVARIGSDGSLEAYTVLRAARVACGVAEVRCGGNILVDSDPLAEEEETRLKAQTLFRVLEGVAPAPPMPEAPASGWKLRQLVGDDPARARLLDALARAGATVETGGAVSVLSGPPATGAALPLPVLAVGDGALWLLRQDGAAPERLEPPRFGRQASGQVRPGSFLGGETGMNAGTYAASALREAALPRGWTAAAVTDEGFVLAAEKEGACALLFRPDSVLSLRGDTGLRALRAALARLDPCVILDRQNKEEAR